MHLDLVKFCANAFNSKNEEELVAAFRALSNLPFVKESNLNESAKALDFTKLEAAFNLHFVGPERPIIATNAGFYFENSDVLFSATTLKFRDFYRSVGLFSSEENRVPDDFVGIALEVYYALLYAEFEKKNEFLKSERAEFFVSMLKPFLKFLCAEILFKAQSKEVMFLRECLLCIVNDS